MKERCIGNHRSLKKQFVFLSLLTLAILLASSGLNALEFPQTVWGQPWHAPIAAKTVAAETSASAAQSVSTIGIKSQSGATPTTQGSVANEAPLVVSHMQNATGTVTYFTDLGDYLFSTQAPYLLKAYYARDGTQLVAGGLFGLQYQLGSVNLTSVSAINVTILAATDSVYSVQYELVGLTGQPLGTMVVTYQFMYNAVNNVPEKAKITANFAPFSVTNFWIEWFTVPAQPYSYIQTHPGAAISHLSNATSDLIRGVATSSLHLGTESSLHIGTILSIDWSDYGKLSSGVHSGRSLVVASNGTSVFANAIQVQFGENVGIVDPSYNAQTIYSNSIGYNYQGHTWFADQRYWSFFSGGTPSQFQYTSSPNGSTWPTFSTAPFSGLSIDGTANATCLSTACSAGAQNLALDSYNTTSSGGPCSGTVNFNSIFLGSSDELAIVIVALGSTSAHVVSINDSFGTTWSLRKVATEGTRLRLEEWYAKYNISYPSTGSNLGLPLNMTLSGSTSCVTSEFAISGANFAAPFDPNTSLPKNSSGTSGTPSVSGVSTTNSNTLLLEAEASAGTTQETAGSGMTLINGAPNPNSPVVTEDSQYRVNIGRLYSSSYSFQSSLSVAWASLIDAITAPPGVGITTTNLNDVCIVDAATTQGDTATAVTDTQNNSWSERSSLLEDSKVQISEWYTTTGASLLTSDVPTVAFSGTHSDSVTAFCIAGANPFNPFDTNSALPKTNGGTSGGTESVSAISTTNPNDMIIGFEGHNVNTPETAASGYSLVVSPPNTNDLEGSTVEEKVVSTTQSSITVSFGTSLGSTNRWAMIVDAIQQQSNINVVVQGNQFAVTWKSPFFYAVLDTGSNAYVSTGLAFSNGSIFWSSLIPISLPTLGIFGFPSIAIDSNGNIWTTHYDYNTSNHFAYDMVFNGTSKVGNRFPLDNNKTEWNSGSIESQPMMVEPLNNSKMMILWGNITGNCCAAAQSWKLYGEVYSSGSFGSATLLSSQLANTLGKSYFGLYGMQFPWNFTQPDTAASSYNNSIYIAYWVENFTGSTSNDYILYRFYNGSTSIWSSPVTAITFPSGEFGPADTDKFPAIAFGPQPNGKGDVYIFYGGNFTSSGVGNFYYNMFNITSSTWLGDVQFFNSTDPAADTAQNLANVIVATPVTGTILGNSTGQFGAEVETGLFSPYGLMYTVPLADLPINYNAVNAPAGNVNTGRLINAIQASQDYLTRLEKVNGAGLSPNSANNFVTESEYPSIPITVYYYNDNCYNAINTGQNIHAGQGSQGDQCLPAGEGDSITNITLARQTEAFDYNFISPEDFSVCGGYPDSPQLLVNITWDGYGGVSGYSAIVNVRPVAFADTHNTCKVNVYLGNTEILRGVGRSSSTWTRASTTLQIRTHPLDGAAIFGQGSVANGFSFSPYASNGVTPVVDLSSFRYATRSGVQSAWKWAETALQPEYGYPRGTNDPTIYSTTAPMQEVVFTDANPSFSIINNYAPQFLFGQQMANNFADDTSAYADCSQGSSLPETFYNNIGTVYPYYSSVCKYTPYIYLQGVYGIDPLLVAESAVQVADTYGPNAPFVDWQNGSPVSPAEIASILISLGWVSQTYGVYYPVACITEILCPGTYFNGDRTAALAQLFTVLGYHYGLTSFSYNGGSPVNFQTYADDMVNAMINAQWGMHTSGGNSGCIEGCGNVGSTSTNYFRPMDIGGENTNWRTGWSTTSSAVDESGEAAEYTGVNPTEQESTAAMLAALSYYYNSVTMTSSFAHTIQNGIQPFDDVMFNGQGSTSYEFVNRTFSLDGEFPSSYANFYVDARAEGDTSPRNLELYLNNNQIGSFSVNPGAGYVDNTLTLNGSNSIFLSGTNKYTLGIRLDSPGNSLSNSTKQDWWVISATIGRATVNPNETLKFTETGLPSGNTWSVKIKFGGDSITKGPFTSSTTSTTFAKIPQFSNVSYSVFNNQGSDYRCATCVGFVYLNSSKIISLALSSVVGTLYSVTWTESGLTGGAIWGIDAFNNTSPSVGAAVGSSSGTTSSLTINLPNGNYYYSVAVPNGFTASSSGGNFVVSGSNINIPTVSFTVHTNCIPQSPIFQWEPNSPAEAGSSPNKTAYIGLQNDGCASFTVEATVDVQGSSHAHYYFFSGWQTIANSGTFISNVSIEVPGETGNVNVFSDLGTNDGTQVSTQKEFTTTLP